MRLLVAGPAPPGLAAALDALHGGVEGPVREVWTGYGCERSAAAWCAANGAAVYWCGDAEIPALWTAKWVDLVLVTPGDTSGAADMAREAGVEVREVGNVPEPVR